MDISGLVRTYQGRPNASNTQQRQLMTPQYQSQTQYTQPSSAQLGLSQATPQNPFSFNPFNTYSGGNINIVVPPPQFSSYIRQRSTQQLLPRNTLPNQEEMARGQLSSYAQNERQRFAVEELPPQHSPIIKPEPGWSSPSNICKLESQANNSHWSSPPSSPTSSSRSYRATTSSLPTGEVEFATEVDNLMKTIQGKSALPYSPSGISKRSMDYRGSDECVSKGKKRYGCTIEGCCKTFTQKTHLVIHLRSHSGAKPYLCKYEGCGRTFSQLGNLKTHENRHTGEKPFQCWCGKRFAQRGNLRAHKIVHNKQKPFLCRLSTCNKQFTQLGNLKQHQNKFHADIIRDLTSKFASMSDGDKVTNADKELWEYFASLYKNSNKGIKGRGKNRKVDIAHSDMSVLPPCGPRSSQHHLKMESGEEIGGRRGGGNGAGLAFGDRLY